MPCEVTLSHTAVSDVEFLKEIDGLVECHPFPEGFKSVSLESQPEQRMVCFESRCFPSHFPKRCQLLHQELRSLLHHKKVIEFLPGRTT